MGRPERPLFPELDPLHAFAAQLRKLRDQAGKPTYAKMARHTGRSSTALSEAAGGDKLPKWETVVAYVTFCGGRPDDYLLAWERARDGRTEPGAGGLLTDDRSPLLINLPRQPSPFFLGREQELAAVGEMLRAEGSGVAIGPVLHGLGGIGKTELALQFAYENRERFSPVWWVRAETAESVASSLALLTRSIEPQWPRSASVADTAAWALRWLAAREGWLLVLDNVTDLASIQPVLAVASGGKVIVTSRRYVDWRALGLAPVMLGALSRQASVDLLVKRAGRSDELPALDALAEEFGGLPLALSHAAAYLVERPHVSLVQYREWLATQPMRLLDAASPAHPGDDIVARTWQVSVRAVAADDPLAAQILEIAAYLGADRIPVDLFVPLADELAVEDAVTVLASYSMVSRVGESMSVHRLLQTVIRSTRTDWGALTRAIDLLHRALPPGDPETAVGNWPRWDRLAPHIAAVLACLDRPTAPALESTMADRLAHTLLMCGFFHRGQGDYRTAVSYFERSVRLREDAFGVDSPQELASRYGLAGGYWSAGRIEEALALAISTMQSRQRVLGPDHPDSLRTSMHAAVALRETGRLEEATALTESTLAKMEEVLGVDDSDTLRARNNLAGCYRAAGRHEEALALHRTTLEQRRRVLGESSPDTLQSRHNLGSGYLAAGHPHEAIPILDETLAARVKLFGPDHPETAHTRFVLAHACAAAGEHSRAIALLDETVRSRRYLLGPQHPDTLAAEAALAEARAR